jgi:hypothetical protein
MASKSIHGREHINRVRYGLMGVENQEIEMRIV